MKMNMLVPGKLYKFIGRETYHYHIEDTTDQMFCDFKTGEIISVLAYDKMASNLSRTLFLLNGKKYITYYDPETDNGNFEEIA